MDHVHPDDRAIYTAAMNEIIVCRRQYYDLTYRVRIKDGTYHSFRFVGGVIKDAEGNPNSIGGVMLSNEIYRVWMTSAKRSEVGAARIGGSIVQIMILCVLGFGVATGLYFAIVRPLVPATRELKFITELKCMELGRVYDLMAQRNMTLNQLAKLSEVSPSTLRNTKRRGGELKVETIERICDALGITLSDFFAQSENAK